ncbi:MAG: hypothetical protein IJO32_06640 [Bacilli bacterium]|nr:hypothetical protein [Bacilli bacterium]
MNLEQLKKNIENDSNLNKYLRGVGKKSDNTQCIIFEDNKWLVFYYERGSKCALKEFDSEILACEYFYKKIKDSEELKKKICKNKNM